MGAEVKVLAERTGLYILAGDGAVKKQRTKRDIVHKMLAIKGIYEGAELC